VCALWGLVRKGDVVVVEGEIMHEPKARHYLLETVTTLPECTNKARNAHKTGIYII